MSEKKGNESELVQEEEGSDSDTSGGLDLSSIRSEDSSVLSENNIMTTAASDITYVFKITGNGDEKKVTLKTIEVEQKTMVNPAVQMNGSEDDEYITNLSNYFQGPQVGYGRNSDHRKTHKKRKKKKKSRKKR